DLVVDEQDLVFIEDSFERAEITGRRDDISAGPLDRFDVKGGELTFARLRIPERVILGLKQTGELFDAVKAAIVAPFAVRAAETIWEGNEMGAVGEVPIASAIAIARRDRRGAERSSMVAAHEGEDQRFAGLVAHD